MTRAVAPTLKGAGQKILRACVVQSGKVIEEKRLFSRESVSIGQAAKNTFAISDPTLPKTHQLFTIKSGQYELVFTEGMRGKVSVDGTPAPVDFANLKAQGLVKKKGSFYHLPLNDGHRGKVMIGDLTLIFQFVVPPPKPVTPKLPPEVRGTIWQKIDIPFALCLAACMFIEIPLIVYFQYAPQPKKLEFDLASIDSRWAELIVPEFKPKDEKPKDKPKPDDKKSDGSQKKAAKQASKKTKPADDDKPPGEKAKIKAAKSKKIRNKIAGKGILAVLGTKGIGGASGVVRDVFSEGGSLGGDLDSAFEGISGVGLATGNARTQRGGGSGEAGGIQDLATSGGGGGKVRASKRERAVGSVKAGGIEDLDGELDASKIARVIRRQSSAIQRCYEAELKRNPKLAGKLEIEITIGENGRVEDTSIITNSLGSNAVAKCAENRIKRWRFPKPDGGSVTFVAPFNFIASS